MFPYFREVFNGFPYFKEVLNVFLLFQGGVKCVFLISVRC